jgi:hypothetical protein
VKFSIQAWIHLRCIRTDKHSRPLTYSLLRCRMLDMKRKSRLLNTTTRLAANRFSHAANPLDMVRHPWAAYAPFLPSLFPFGCKFLLSEALCFLFCVSLRSLFIYFKTKFACVHIRWLSNTTRVVCFFHNAPIASLLRMYHNFGTVGSLRKHIYGIVWSGKGVKKDIPEILSASISSSKQCGQNH